MYNRYSTSEWGGSVPEQWLRIPIKRLFNVVSGATPSSVDSKNWNGSIAWITPADFSNTSRYIVKGKKSITDTGYRSCGTTIVPQGSIVITKRAPIGNVMIAANKLCTNQGCLSLVKKKDLNEGYFYFLLSCYAGIFNALGTGTTFKEISLQTFSDFKIPVPSRTEQDQIVRYLDWKTSEIHRLINGLQQQILLLKQRNQVIIDHAVTKGIRKNRELRADKAEWMGSVPSEWLSCRMKNFFIETNVRSVDGHEPHLSMSQKKGLVTDDEDIERRLLSESYVGGKVCQKDDLVLNRLKAHLGVFALAPMEGVISPDYTVLHLNQDRIIPKYAEYLLRSNACRKELRTRVRGIVEGFWRLYTEDLGSIPVCLPDIDEQKEILDYVKDYEEKSNQMIGKLEKEIELLREYRTRLISDVVTGQMDVRNVEIPDYIPEQDEVIDAVDETDVGEVDADAE